MKKLKTLELFAGVGGFSIGLEETGYFETEAFCEINKDCRMVLNEHWPNTKIFRDVKNIKYIDGHFGHSPGEEAFWNPIKIDCIVGGFPCFTGDTLILTKTGYKTIADIELGEVVLTHKGRWRHVIQKDRRDTNEIIKLKGQGIPLTYTTSEHPYYTKGHKWVEAGKLLKGDMLGMTFPKRNIIPHNVDYNYWWLVGRYIADGWLVNRLNRGDGNTCRVVICCGKHETADIEKRLNSVFNYTKSEERTVFKYHITNKEFAEFLKPIGRGALNKQIPPTWFQYPKECLTSLLDGYFSGDGSIQKGRFRVTTVSKKLALSVCVLIQKVHGVSGSLYEHKVAPKKLIEGRLVNQNTQYCVAYTPRGKRTTSVVEDNYIWKELKEVDGIREENTVYNIGVEDDESYIANNCIVHNCQDASTGNTKGKGIAGERTGLWKEFKRIIDEVRPKYVIAENVPNLRSRGLGEVLQDFRSLGYVGRADIVSARSFGSPHQRERLLIVATHPDNYGFIEKAYAFSTKDSKEQWESNRRAKRPFMQGAQWASEPNVGRVVHGVPYELDINTKRRKTDSDIVKEIRDTVREIEKIRVKRIKQLGNAVVPAMINWVGHQIGEWENG